MIEKVNPSHPDKIADRIAGALVDLAYKKERDPKIAVEVLVGHGNAYVTIETGALITQVDVMEIVWRIAGPISVYPIIVPQDDNLAKNESDGFRCGDNGIFRGAPLTEEQKELSRIARLIYKEFPSDGKYILDGDKLIVCQSQASREELFGITGPGAIINPLGYWTGGPNVDTGATNRKLGSDMADSMTGGGIHGKDLSKADVSANIYAFLKAQKTGQPIEMCCAIGDTEIDGVPFSEIVEIARDYIDQIGGFEKLAEWGLY